MDNSYLDALVVALFASLALVSVALIFMLGTLVMHRGMGLNRKGGGFGLRGGGRHAKQDSNKDVIIAAAVAGYLLAEQERKL